MGNKTGSAPSPPIVSSRPLPRLFLLDGPEIVGDIPVLDVGIGHGEISLHSPLRPPSPFAEMRGVMNCHRYRAASVRHTTTGCAGTKTGHAEGPATMVIHARRPLQIASWLIILRDLFLLLNLGYSSVAF